MDRIYYNARVYSLVEKDHWAPAMLVRGDRVVALGDRRSLDMIAKNPKHIDLGGSFVYPGFTDAHVHLLWLGLNLQRIDLQGCSLAETLHKVRERAKTVELGTWIEGWGFNYNNWPEGKPHKAWLDEICPYNPVVLRSKDAHLIWVNSAVLKACGIGRDTPDPLNGLIERDEHGNPTGLLMENAIPLVTGQIPKPARELYLKAVNDAVKLLNSYGIVAVHDMGDPGDGLTLSVLQQYRQRFGLDLRITTALPYDKLAEAVALGIRACFGDEYLRIGGIKAFADGSLGAQTAWTLEPYEGSGSRGLPTLASEELNALVRDANAQGLPVLIHAIGDAANRAVLDALETHGRRDLRNRIEHVQLIAEDDLPRLARLGVVASMQPTHCPQDRYMADRLWGERSKTAYAFQSLLKHGATLAFGSDTPVEDANVLVGLYSAVARKRWNEPHTDPWYGEQRISMWDALRAFTCGGAYAAGEEAYRGTLSPGMKADFVVLTKDILGENDPEILKETKIVATYVGGRCVYERPA